MDLYRFSPIETPAELMAAAQYIATECTWLFFNAVGVVPQIKSLTIFAHYDDEFDYLSRLLPEFGETSDPNNGPRIRLTNPIVVTVEELDDHGHTETVSQTIEYLRVRQPDPYRMQVGCCDYEVKDYWDFKEFFGLDAIGARTIKRPNYEMLEFHDPSRDVLGYVVGTEVP